MRAARGASVEASGAALRAAASAGGSLSENRLRSLIAFVIRVKRLRHCQRKTNLPHERLELRPGVRLRVLQHVLQQKLEDLPKSGTRAEPQGLEMLSVQGQVRDGERRPRSQNGSDGLDAPDRDVCRRGTGNADRIDPRARLSQPDPCQVREERRGRSG